MLFPNLLLDANTLTVLFGTSLLGAACGAIGTFAVLRRRALLADALAHASLPGVCIAFLIFGQRNMALFLCGALLSGGVAAGFIAAVKYASRVKEDGAIAIAIGLFFGVGIALLRVIQNTPGGQKAGLENFIFGKAASMTHSDVQAVLIVAGVASLACVLLFREIAYVCFDTAFARAQGIRTKTVDALLLVLICLCTVAGLPAIGALLVVALMIIPTVSARLWSDRLEIIAPLASAFGACSGALGTILSATLPAPAHSLSRGWPTGPLIVLVAIAFLIISLLVTAVRPRKDVWSDDLRSESSA